MCATRAWTIAGRTLRQHVGRRPTTAAGDRELPLAPVGRLRKHPTGVQLPDAVQADDVQRFLLEGCAEWASRGWTGRGDTGQREFGRIRCEKAQWNLSSSLLERRLLPYATKTTLADKLMAVLEDQACRGQVFKLNKQGARRCYPDLVVASLGAVRREKPRGVVTADPIEMACTGSQ